ncbi:dihydrodipicolinate synthase family protein [Enterococcus sp. AZ196]|uniref:dihydrodipicolinate synthase family protein n=1 Tax=Enterococcus sp. AZ196 TaxID=2774659 RepID=UPI003D2CD1E1
MDLKGIYAAMLTPLTEEGGVDVPALERMIAFYVDKGISGVFAVSSVGEAAHFDTKEARTILETVKAASEDKLQLFAGVTATTSSTAVEVGKIAEELGYDGIVSAPPYFYQPSDDAILAYFEDINDQVDLPLIVYNVPLFAPALSKELLVEVAKLTNVVGVKESSGNLVDVLHILDMLKDEQLDTSFLIGREEMYLSSLIAGADGCMVATAGIIPEAYQKIEELYLAGRISEAAEVQQAILPLLRECFKVNFPAGFKVALAARGLDTPLYVKRKMSEQEQQELARSAETIKQEVARILAFVGTY